MSHQALLQQLIFFLDEILFHQMLFRDIFLSMTQKRFMRLMDLLFYITILKYDSSLEVRIGYDAASFLATLQLKRYLENG